MEDRKAKIYVHREKLWNGHDLTTYTWEGDIRGVVWIPSHVDITQLPWPLKRIEDGTYDPLMQRHVRTDVNWWWIAPAIEKVKNWFRQVEGKLVVTIHIWTRWKIGQGVELRLRNLKRRKR
jgi:hypothetical protein